MSSQPVVIVDHDARWCVHLVERADHEWWDRQISGTDQLDPNRSVAVDIAIAITHAIERGNGGQ